MTADTRGFNVPDRASGMATLTAGADSGSVAVTFPDVPVRTWVTVVAPAGGDTIFATVVGDPTDSGFDFQLSAAPPAAGYKLSYVCDF